MMRSIFFVLALTCCGVVAYLGLLAEPNAAIHLDRSRQILSERAGDPAALAEARAAVDRAIVIAQRSGQTTLLRDALLQRGTILQRLGSYAPALRDFQTVIELDPASDIQTIFEIVNTLISAGKRFEKLEAFDRAFEFLAAAESSPTSPVARSNGRLAAARAQCYAARAEARIEQQRDVLLALNDGSDPALRIRALEELSACIDEGPRAEALRAKLLGHLVAAEELRRKEILSAVEAAREDVRAAIRNLEESVTEAPRAHNLARLLELESSAEHWERVLDLSALFDSEAGRTALGVAIDQPLYEVVPYSRARAQRAVGRAFAARTTLDRFLEANPGVVGREIFLEHLDLLAALGDGARVLELVERVREIPTQISNPRVARALPYYEGLGCAATKELLRAKEGLLLFVSQATIRSEPKRLPQALERLASICEELGEPEEANRYQERLVPLLENPARVFAELARRAFERQQEYEEASRLLLRAMQLDPPLALEWMPLWRRIGEAFLARAGADLEGASSQAIKSTSLRSYLFDPSVLFLASEHLVSTGRALDALPILLNLSQLAPRLAAAQRLRARASAALGHHTRAVKAFQDYLELVPEDRSAWVDLEQVLEHAADSVSPAQLRSIRFRALRATLPERGGIELARRLLENGELERALELARARRPGEVQRAELDVTLARALLFARPEEALRLLDGVPASSSQIGAARLLALRVALRLEDSPESSPERIAERVRTVRGTVDLPTEDLLACVATLVEKDRGTEAVDFLNLVPVESGSRSARWYRLLGLALAQRRDWRRAEVALDRAIAFGDDQALRAAIDLFLVLYGQQRIGEARELVELLRKMPIASLGRYPLWIGALLALAGDLGGAAAVLEKTPADDHPFASAARAVQRLALLAAASAPEATPPPAPAPPTPSAAWVDELEAPMLLLFLEAVVLREAGGRAPRLRALCEHLLVRHPRSATLQLLLAEALHDLGRHAAVIPLIQIALGLSPEMGPALELLARTVRATGSAEQRWQIAAQRLAHLCAASGSSEESIAALAEELLYLDRPNEVLAALYQLGPRAERSTRLLALSARAWSALGQPDRAQRQVRELWLRFDASRNRDEIARRVGREYLRALRLGQEVGWNELEIAAPRLAELFPQDPLIRVLATEVELRAARAAEQSASTAASSRGGRRDPIAALTEDLLGLEQSLYDDGPSAAARILSVLQESDVALYERVLWTEMSKRPERSQLWLWHAEALLALGRESEVVEEYRLLGCFETNAAAMVGRARHLARVRWDDAEAQQILAELEASMERASADQRASLLAARVWLLNAMGRAQEALALLEGSGVAPDSSLVLREAYVRAAMSAGDPQALREAARLAFDASGAPALSAPLVAQVLKRAVASLPR